MAAPAIAVDRRISVGLAAPSCAKCGGLGMVCSGRPRALRACSCVLRRIFRECYRRYDDCGWEPAAFVAAEYRADFELIARRVLNELERQIFRLHFVRGLDWKVCTRRCGIDRGSFFHRVYEIEETLGSAYQGTEPYGLYPTTVYFGGIA